MMREPAWRRYERFHRRDVERDVDEELAAHYEMLIDNFVARGQTREQAEEAARRTFAGAEVAAAECKTLSHERAERSDRRALWTDLATDVRTAARLAWSHPRATLATIGTAVAALLAATVAFSVADRMFLQRPPFLADFSRTHRVYVYGRSFFGDERYLPSVTYQQFSNLRATAPAFAAVVATCDAELLAGPPGSTLRWSQTTLATGAFWSLFNAHPALGRFYSPNDEATPVAVISHRVWETQFDSDRNVVGRDVRVGAGSFRVIGVLPRGFAGLHGPPADYVLPLQAGMRAITAQALDPAQMRGQWLALIVRRQPATSIAVATAQLSRALDSSETEPQRAAVRALLAPVQPARGPTASDEARLTEWMSVLAVLLLISAIVNLAGLQTTRIARRRHELAVRTALGMTRARLTQMVVVDTVAQLAAAAVIASAVTGVFMAMVARVAFPDLPTFRSDEPMRLVLFIVAAALVIGVTAGIGAALHVASSNVVEGLSDGASGGPGRWLIMRHIGTAVQGGAAIVLVVCAMLFLSSLRAASHAPLGYDADRLVWITSQPRRGASRADLAAELSRLRAGLSADSNVERVALADRAPRMAYVRTNVYVDSSEVPTSAELGYHRVGREYFDVMGMRVREGRAFSPTPSAAHEIVVSQEMASELAPEGSALGICLRLSSATAPCRTVVGVVDDIRDMRLDRWTSAGYYILSSADEEWLSGLIVRARDAGRVHLVQQAAARLTTNSFSVESYAVSTLVAEGRRTWQAGAVVLSLFAGVAILLSVVGLSASIAEDASRRTHEFALRAAIGAGPFQLAALVAREGAVAVARMVAIGGPAATLVVVCIRPLLFGATAVLTPALVASAIVVMITLLSLSLPALHLRHVDAASVLRATM